MSDLISRQAAIDALYIPDYENGEAYLQYVNDKRAIELLPAAQPECKKGWWVEMGVNADKTHNIVCSKCGEGYKTKGHAKSIATRAKWKFCPSCGADMRGERDG